MSQLPLPSGNSLSAKTVVLQRMDTRQSLIIQAQLNLSSPMVDLSPLLAQHCPKYVRRVLIYDPATNAFLPLKNRACTVDRILLDPAFVFLRYDPKEPSQRMGSSRQGRSKERTIGQAIQLVRQWRTLHQTLAHHHNKRKKISLPEAADMLGVSKKSLDDYYCQLRIGQQFGFDFQAHLHDGIGVLRAFASQRRRQAGKYQKVLRVIEDLPFVSSGEPPKENSLTTQHEQIQTEQATSPHQEKVVEAQKECPREGHIAVPALSLEISNLELEYYRGFEYLLDQPVDPFMDLARNFSVHLSDEESQNIFFY